MASEPLGYEKPFGKPKRIDALTLAKIRKFAHQRLATKPTGGAQIDHLPLSVLQTALGERPMGTGQAPAAEMADVLSMLLEHIDCLQASLDEIEASAIDFFGDEP